MSLTTGAPMSRTRLDRIRASVGIAQLALHQIEDDLMAESIDQAELAAILRELVDAPTRPAGSQPPSPSCSPPPRAGRSRSNPWTWRSASARSCPAR
ncbi:hypothetical protein [Streptomyces sp. NPDC098781]|uniref:hypothetical protein n=1 Tax=Streptomyces sp. NPDC098781 TaxID=3366097 RepID=UPI0037F6DB8C